MSKFINLKDEKFGKLIVINYSGKNKRGQSQWLCLCDCGNKKVIAGSNLKSGHTRSCGCLNSKAAKNCNIKQAITKTKIYLTWRNMKDRCYNPKNNRFKSYGGRGIKVCDRWLHSFENFFEDMGDVPKDMTLDRKDANSDYCKDNCRWATWEVQENNRTNNHLITFKNKTQTLSQWAREIGVKPDTLERRINLLKFPIEKALTMAFGRWPK